MSEEVNKEQAKGAKQEKITELADEQLDEAAGGDSQGPDPNTSEGIFVFTSSAPVSRPDDDPLETRREH